MKFWNWFKFDESTANTEVDKNRASVEGEKKGSKLYFVTVVVVVVVVVVIVVWISKKEVKPNFWPEKYHVNFLRHFSKANFLSIRFSLLLDLTLRV